MTGSQAPGNASLVPAEPPRNPYQDSPFGCEIKKCLSSLGRGRELMSKDEAEEILVQAAVERSKITCRQEMSGIRGMNQSVGLNSSSSSSWQRSGPSQSRPGEP
eukprot:6573312-Alexandrium_andersonii.AAC.1